MTSPLDWFGLPPEADEREIKRAYAKRLKTVRPDSDPAGFQELHEMYRRALAWRAHAAATALADAEDEPEQGIEAMEEAPASPAPLDDLPAPPADEPPRAEPPSTPGAWRPVRFNPPTAAPAPPPAPPSLDLHAFVETYLDLATTSAPTRLQSWLHEQPALWSLQTKQQAGRALIQRLLQDPPPIDGESIDATLRFFDLDHTQSGVDPLHLHQLRTIAQERHELMLRHDQGVQPWGAQAQQLELEPFLAWLRALALAGDRETIEATLCVQPALRNLALRQAVAHPLFERLWLERPPMPAPCGWLLVQFFGLRPLLAKADQTPQDFVARLEIAWLMLEQNKNALATVTKEPKVAYPMPNQAWRRLQQLRQPFRWWWIAAAALVPNLLSSMGRFALRLCQGNVALLDGFFDPRMTRFCAGAAERFVVTRPRAIVGALRCLALLLAGLLMYAMSPPANRGGFLAIAGIATAAWMYYLAFLMAWRWQQQPEEPITPHPRLRMAFVPLLALAGLAIYYTGQANHGRDWLFPAQLLALPAFMLGYLRWRARNPGKRSFLSKLPDTLAGIFIIILGVLLLSHPLPPAAAALTFWAIDLFKQRKQLRFR